jgi:iron complex transport system ATP-binding protein
MRQVQMTSPDKRLVLQGVELTVRRGDRTLLDNISIEVGRGELVFVVGPNGAGKSTLIRSLAGLVTKDLGKIIVQGSPQESLDRRAFARLVALVEQAPELAIGFTVREVVEMGRAPFQDNLLRSSGHDLDHVARALEACDLVDLAQRPIETLSGGEQRRVSIARALAQDTPVLLMDEPGAHLDSAHALSLAELVRREVDQRQRACLIVSHDLNIASHFADRVVVMDAGKIVADGPPGRALSDDILAKVFRGSLVSVQLDALGRYIVPPRRTDTSASFKE